MSETTSSSQQQSFKQEFYPLKVVQPYAWLGIVAVVIGFGGALTWAVFGSIRESVSTIGVVSYPRGLRQIYSPTTERIKKITVEEGQSVTEGYVIAQLEARSQLKKIQTAQEELIKLEKADSKLQELVVERMKLAKTTDNQLKQVYKPLADKAEELFEQQLITASNFGSAKKEYLNTQQTFYEQLTNLRTLERTLDLQIFEKKADIKQLQTELSENYTVETPTSGKIININYQIGDYPSSNVPLATMISHALPQTNKDNIVVATAKSGDIDKLTIGNYALFTPDNVERNRYGGIVAKVAKIQRAPITPEYLVNYIGSKQIAEKLVTDQKLYYMQLELIKDKNTPTGYKWSSGKGPGTSTTVFPNLLGKATIYYQTRSPITYVMPFIRHLIGLEDNPKSL